MWAQAINAVLGIWLMMCPWILNFNGSGRIVDRIGGPIVLTIGLFAMREVTRFGRYVNILPGAWILIGPLAFHYAHWVPIVNGVVIGIAVIALSLVRGTIKQPFGVGWMGVVLAAREDGMQWWQQRQQRKASRHKQPGHTFEGPGGQPTDGQQRVISRP